MLDEISRALDAPATSSMELPKMVRKAASGDIAAFKALVSATR